MKKLSGVLTALITPFDQGEIDFASLAKLVRYQLDRGIGGFVVGGTTAESPTLTSVEKQKLFDFVKSESGSEVPIVMGTGSNSTAATVAATREAAKWGADAALVVVPYYNKPPQRGLFQHFQKVAESSDLPILLYNVPGRSITQLEVPTIAELSRLPNIVGIKEATGDIAFGQQVIAECEPNFIVTSGDDGTFLSLTKVGGAGVISVASHIFPKEFSEWQKRVKAGDVEPISEFDRIRDLNAYLYCEANPIPIKMACHLMCLIKSPELRLPLVTLAEPYKAELLNKMKSAGLL